MKAKKAFTLQSFLILLVGNALLVAAVLFVTGAYLTPEWLWMAVGAGALVTLVEWLAVRGVGARAINRAAQTSAVTSAPEPETLPAPEPASEPAPPRLEKPEQPPEAAAIQMLAILQRKGRLLDFLQEDVQPYDDAQIGAAVRGVHEGCRQALREHLTLEPIMDQPEGSRVTVEPGFDAGAIRLTGHVAGEPPFTGELRHRGWRVARIDLPELTQTQDRVAAAAEVEVR